MTRVFAAISLAALLLVVGFAQSKPPQPIFEFADVHPSPRTMNPFMRSVLRGGRYELLNANMVDLIRTAYSVDPEKVVGGPHWVEFDRFDVIAPAPSNTPPETLKLMLQALLADRFKLVVHNDTQPIAGFVLTIGKGKPKLKEAEPSGNPGCQLQPDSCRTRPWPNFNSAYHCFLPQPDHGGVCGRAAATRQWLYQQRCRGFDGTDRLVGLRSQVDPAGPASISRVRRNHHIRCRR